LPARQWKNRKKLHSHKIQKLRFHEKTLRNETKRTILKFRECSNISDAMAEKRGIKMARAWSQYGAPMLDDRELCR
jgi:hypothetical protein